MSNSSSLNGKPDDDESRKSWTVKDWYTHVGAWEDDKGQLCFGSTMAFSAMLTQFHRVHTAPAEQQGEPVAWLWRDGCMVETTAKLTEEQRSSGRWQPLYTAAPQAVRLPDGYCVMPRRLTAENGAKALLLGEFKVEVRRECTECAELDDPAEGCEICDGEGEFSIHQTISWDQIKFIYSEAVKGLALTEAQFSGPSPTYAEYTTSPGESLAGIAGRQLKDSGRWVEIRDLNAHAFPDMLPHDYYPVGTKLRLPA